MRNAASTGPSSAGDGRGPVAAPIPDPLLVAARRRPEQTALVNGPRRLDYRAVARAALAVAGQLRAMGIAPGDRVALLAGETPAAVVVIHGIRLAGAVLVPLQRRSPAAELERLARRVRPALVVHDAATADAAGGLAALAPVVDLVGLGAEPLGAEPVAAVRPGIRTGGGRQAATAGDLESRAAPLVPDRPGAILLTSGTTGLPRPAILRHRNLLASAAAWNAFLRPRRDDVWLAALPFSHVAGLGIILRATLAALPIVVHERFDPDAVLRDLRALRVSHLSLVPTQLRRLLDAAGPARIEAPGLRGLLLGGAPIPPDLAREAVAAGLPIVPTYGLTEAASGVTALAPGDAVHHPESAGRPLSGIAVRILGDGDRAEPGQIGEILVAGPTVFAGYADDPGATARALADGWLHTGDLGALDEDGRLVVVERSAERIISGGENVSPTEVEAVLTAHPDVAEAVVVGRPDPEWGSVPVAGVALRPGSPLADASADALEASLQAFVREHLAAFKVPKRIVRLDAVPRTSSGKIRRGVAAERIEAGLAAARLIEPGRAQPDAPGGRPASAPTVVEVVRPDGAVLAVRCCGIGPPLLLLHATLSTAADYDPLAARLAERFTVLAVDRRSAGASREPPPRLPEGTGRRSGRAAGALPGPVDVGVHVEDLVAVFGELLGREDDASSLRARPRAVVVGHSFGGVVGLELAARHPELVSGVWVFEPPYAPAGPPEVRPFLAGLAERLALVAARDGIEAAGVAFLAAVSGRDPSRLSERALEAARREARSALADAALLGLDPTGLGRITAPVAIVLGARSITFYRRIAEGLAARLPTASLETLPGLDHAGPVRAPGVVAEAILRWQASRADMSGELGTQAPPDADPA